VAFVDAHTVATGAVEAVLLWNVRLGQEVARMEAPRREDLAAPRVTCLAVSPAAPLLAAGYSDGSVRLWDLGSRECRATLSGHRRGVTALRFSADGARLASGGQDTDINLWDVVGETGLFKLRGHKGAVTGVVFLEGDGKLASSSKDSFVRVWDLESQHCSQTVVGHRSEVWSLAVSPDGTRLATGSSDAEVRVFAVGGPPGAPEGAEGAEDGAANGKRARGEGAAAAATDTLHAMGSLRRKMADRAGAVAFGGDGRTLVVASAGKGVEVFRVREGKELHQHMKRRQKRAKKKDGEGDAAPAAEERGAEDAAVTASDEFAPLHELRLKHKVVSVDVRGGSGKGGELASLAVGLANNSLELFRVTAEELEGTFGVSLPGHRSDVRAVCLSADDSLLVSTSNAGAKVWNPRTGKCLRSVDGVGYGLSATFCGDGRHVAVGTKEGALELINVDAGQVVQKYEAHTGALWSVCRTPDSSGLVTASADKDVKVWEFEATRAGEGSRPRLGLKNTRTLRLSDDVLCVRCSPDGKFVACALLDSTIKVFFLDSFKFYLSLYGHKLPALSMDISSDSTLLVSGSADKNIKIWGLDFGDCHKTLFAHRDSVMQVAFVPRTHYVFTCGRDGSVSYWDCDKFQQLLTLEGHYGECWALAVGSLGDLVISGGHDRSLRRWERTDEPFFVEEEAEKRLDSMFEETLAEQDGGAGKDAGAEGVAGAAGVKTVEAVTSADAVTDALEMAEAEARRLRGDGEALPNPLMLGLSPADYVLRSVSGIRAADLEQALLVLPFTDALRLLGYMPDWVTSGRNTELCVRIVNLLVRIHHQQLASSPQTRGVLASLQERLRASLGAIRGGMGFNATALDYIRRQIQATATEVDEMGVAVA